MQARLNIAVKKMAHLCVNVGEIKPLNNNLGKRVSPCVLSKEGKVIFDMLISTCRLFFLTYFQGDSMKIVIASLISALMLLSMPTFAGSHGGGKIDCKDPKNKDHKDCQKK